MAEDYILESDWYRLDNSAKIYPAIMTDRQTTLFRVAFVMKDEIDPDSLQKALERIYPRFPYFNVCLRKGFFWNYLERNKDMPFIDCDTPTPCEGINPIYSNGFLYKVLYFQKRIAVEFSHVISDGFGALEFGKTLVLEYLRLLGHDVTNDGSVMDVNEPPDEGEFLDDHVRYAKIYGKPTEEEKERNLFGKTKAFLVKGRVLPSDRFHIITGVVDADKIRNAARSFDATITELLTAIYLESLIEVQHKQVRNQENYRSVAVQVPVNMRNKLDSRSMRNFSLFVTPTLAPDASPPFGEIIKFTSSFIRENAQTKRLVNILRDNVSVGESPVVRHIPLFIKLPVTKYIVNTSGSAQHSGTISNIGLIKLPESMAAHVEDIFFNLGPDPHAKTSAAVSGYNGRVYITFGRVIKDAMIERLVFRKLVKLGVPVKLQSN